MSTQQQAERLKVAKPDLLDLPPELFRMIIEQVVVCLSFVCKDLRSYIDNNDTLSHKMFRMTLAESAMDDDEQLEWFEDLWPDEIYESVYKQHSEDNIEDLVDHQQTDDDNEEVGDEEDDGEEEAEEEKRPCDSIAWTNIKINPLLLALSGLRDGEVDGDDALDIEIDDHYVERVKLLRTISVELAMSQRQELQKLWRGMYATWPPVEYAIISFPKRHSCIRLRSKYGFTLGDADKFIEIPVKGPGVLGYNTLQASCGHSLPRLSLLHRRAYTSAYASMSKIEQRDSMQWLYGRGAWRKSWLPIR